MAKNSKYYRHISVITKDEAIIDVTDTDIQDDQYHTICNPVVIDRSRSKVSVNVTLAGKELSKVVRVVGSNNSDVIIGNEMDNVITGRRGNDHLQGGEGADFYVIQTDDGVKTINNYAMDMKNDTIMIGVNYNDILTKRQSNDLILLINGSSTHVILQSWFVSDYYRHVSITSKDFVTFLVTANDHGNITKNPITIDFSKSELGVTLNLQGPLYNNTSEVEIDKDAMQYVKLITDSPHDDSITGNAQDNVISCSGGFDYLQGNNGSDTYVIKQSCNGSVILNEDEVSKYDVLLLNCSHFNIELLNSSSGEDLIIICSLELKQIEVKLLKWFVSPIYQHLMVKTLNDRDRWTFLPPEAINQSFVIEPYQIEMSNEDCGDEMKEVDLNEPPYQQVQKFTAKSMTCRYNVIGNELNNYIDPGPSDVYGYQMLTGGNGSDTYVLGHYYGVNNAINNSATDDKYDHLLFNVIYENIHMIQKDNDIVMSSLVPNNSVNVTLLDYCKGKQFQHLLIHASNGVIFQIKIRENAVLKEVAMVDYSNSTYTQIISPSQDPTLDTVRVIIGSKIAKNSINGSNQTIKIIGGNVGDRIIGGSFVIGEDILGLDGDDYIDGRAGNDHILGGDGKDTLLGGDDDDEIYGGPGADLIDGGTGSDSIVFSGNGTNSTGVMINLQVGKGWYSDAEGDVYTSVENIFGSEYDDVLIGDDQDNVIRGYGGDDFIMPLGGLDVLQGGIGADVYDMENAYGLKVINNFATDHSTDTLLLVNVKKSQLCHYSSEENLHIVVNYNDHDLRNAMSRVFLGRQYLELKILNFFKNDSYKHFKIMLSDNVNLQETEFMHSSNLTQLSNETEKGEVLSIDSITSESLLLHINFISASFSSVRKSFQLNYVHGDYESMTTNAIKSSKSQTIRIKNLKAGVQQMFSILLMSCNVKVAISPYKFAITLPNSPSHITVINTRYDGFTIKWTPPTNETDPNVYFYSYIIKYWSEDNPEKEYCFVYNISYVTNTHTVYGLLPNKNYMVSIASKVFDTEGTFSSLVKVRTNGSLCINFDSLPEHMYIEKIMHNKSKNKLFAYLNCDEDYQLSGNVYLVCNETSINNSSRCDPIQCSVPPYQSLNASPVSNHTTFYVGDTVLWNCSEHYWTVDDGSLQFNTTCDDNGQWTPPLQHCILKPACPNYPTLENGQVSPLFAYVGEPISFKCNSHYARLGPPEKICEIIMNKNNKTYDIFSKSNSMRKLQMNRLKRFSSEKIDAEIQTTLEYYPKVPVTCVLVNCPLLLPQEHGNYLKNSSAIYKAGDNVTLKCDLGYYIRDDFHHPELQIYKCTEEGIWNIEPKKCQPILTIVRIKMSFLQVVGIVRYAVPKLSDVSVLNRSLYQFACGLLGGLKLQLILGMQLTCTINYQLTDHPPLDGSNVANIYAGTLIIAYQYMGKEIQPSDTLCVRNDITNDYSNDSLNFVRFVCDYLGYDEYTPSLQPQSDSDAIGKEVTIKFHEFEFSISNKTQHCNNMISCRKSCPLLSAVPHAVQDQCNKTMEKEKCTFSCSKGYTPHGSTSRTCQDDGTWSGNTTRCDKNS